MTMHTGACSCGHIGITAACEPQIVSMCHCLLCQKRTGSTYSVHAYFPTEHVTVQGTTNVYARKGDSGAYVYFHFCPECGATMYWEVEATPGKTGIPVGVLRIPRSRRQVFLSSRHSDTRGFRFPRASLRTRGTVQSSRPQRPLRSHVGVSHTASARASRLIPVRRDQQASLLPLAPTELMAATCRRADCRQRLLSQAVKWNSRPTAVLHVAQFGARNLPFSGGNNGAQRVAAHPRPPVSNVSEHTASSSSALPSASNRSSVSASRTASSSARSSAHRRCMSGPHPAARA